MAVEAQATFQQWIIVALIGLAITVASFVFPVGSVREDALEVAPGRG
jgi:hypothetical protein